MSELNSRQSFLMSVLPPTLIIPPILTTILRPLTFNAVNHLPAGPTSPAPAPNPLKAAPQTLNPPPLPQKPKPPPVNPQMLPPARSPLQLLGGDG